MTTAIEKLGNEQIKRELAKIPDWKLGADGKSISRTFDCGDFEGAIDFVNGVADEAEEMNHHPDMTISYKKVTMTLSTHKLGGLSKNDFELARRIEAVFEE